MNRDRTFCGLFLFCFATVLFYQTASASRTNGELMNILPHNRIIPGYDRYISGQKFNYHSLIPGIKKSLLVRAGNGKMAIEWETAPVPVDMQTDQVQFIWLAGLGCNLGVKKFTLYVRDKPLFTFASWDKDHWELSGGNGARLRFAGGMKDHVGDVFGYMVLTLKKESLQPGESVRLKVVGEKANIQAWYMTFQHAVQSFVRLATQPVLTRKNGNLFQGVKLEMFREFERKYGATLPVLSGDFTPYWEDGAASTAQATAINRAASERLVQVSVIWSLLNPAPFPEDQFIRAWKHAILYDEHTWGAWNSISDPDADFVKQQWAWKERQALDADSLSRVLLQQSLRRHAASGRGQVMAVDVFNTTSWARTDLVVLPQGFGAGGKYLIDDGGEPVPLQQLASGEIVFVAHDVPPLGAKRFFFRKSGANVESTLNVDRLGLANEYLSLSINPDNGTISSLKMAGAEVNLVDSAEGYGLNDFIYIKGRDPKNRTRASGQVTVAVREQGPVMGVIEIASKAPGCKSLIREIRIVNGLPRIDIIDRIDKLAIRTPEGVHIAFPFHVPDGKLRMDTPLATVRPERDQLPGACKNWFTVQRWVDVANSDYGVTWATVDAPLVEVGDIRADATVYGWLEHIKPSQKLYSYVMNNYWETNYKADQSGEIIFRYAIQPHRRIDSAAPHRFGIEASQPLVVAPVSLDQPVVPSWFTVHPAQVLVTLLKPTSEHKAWIVRLYNTSKNAANVKLQPEGKHFRAFMSNLFEERGELVQGTFLTPGYAVRTLWIEED